MEVISSHSKIEDFILDLDTKTSAKVGKIVQRLGPKVLAAGFLSLG